MPIRAILIDPTAKTVGECELEDGSLLSLKNAVGGSGYVQMVRLARNTCCWVDEEGLLAPKPGPFFAFTGSDPMAGRGVITGLDDAGETIMTTLSVRLVKDNVTFPDVEFAGFKDSVEDDVEIMPGIKGTRFRKDAIFKPRAGAPGTGDAA